MSREKTMRVFMRERFGFEAQSEREDETRTCKALIDSGFHVLPPGGDPLLPTPPPPRKAGGTTRGM